MLNGAITSIRLLEHRVLKFSYSFQHELNIYINSRGLKHTCNTQVTLIILHIVYSYT